MTRRLPLAIVAVAALAALPAAPASAAKRACSAKRSSTLVASKQARVYVVVPRGDQVGRVYACLYSRNRRYFLGEDLDCQQDSTVERFVLAGRYVAYAEVFCNIDQADTRVNVLNLRTGRRRAAEAVIGVTSDAETPSTWVHDIVLRRTGSVAWIGHFDTNGDQTIEGPGDTAQVRKLELGSTASTLVDSGPDIVAGSLALAEGELEGAQRFYWQKGGTPFTSTLS